MLMLIYFGQVAPNTPQRVCSLSAQVLCEAAIYRKPTTLTRFV
jgi:hypothetical protein